MSNELRENIKQMKEIIVELNTFSRQLDLMNSESNDNTNIKNSDKDFLEGTIVSLINQLRILNNSFPGLINRIGLYKGLSDSTETKNNDGSRLAKIKYKSSTNKEISLVISEEDRMEFLKNLSRSKLSSRHAKKEYVVKGSIGEFRKPSKYAKISNNMFRNFSSSLIAEGYFKKLNRNLRKINSRYIIGTYVSIIFLTSLLTLIASIILFIALLFFDISFISPFVTLAEGSFYPRIIKFFWIIFVFPLTSMILLYFLPGSEAKNLGRRIDQELPFVTIHMSAIASSGVEPISIFKIILKGKDYRYTNIEFRKLMNLINFHGESIVNALKSVSLSSPSSKLRDLLNGLAITITSGGDLRQFLDKHAESMLFDYRLEREKYNKISETFMDIYISVAIAAPMIFLMIFVIIGSTGMLSNFFNLSIDALSFILILIIFLLNVFFLLFLKIKQPVT